MTRLSPSRIARLLDITIGCVLSAANKAGACRFWCCEERFDYHELKHHRNDRCGGAAADIELEASTDTLSDLADELEWPLEEILAC